MSQLKVNAISDAAGANGNAITLATDGTCTAKITSNLSNRNLIINGAMQVNQRVSTPGLDDFNPVTSALYTLDRWILGNGSSFDTDSMRIKQVSDSPDEFSNSLRVDIGNTETPGAGQNAAIAQRIEAQHLQHLAYGTSSAKSCTLSFWVRSNKTGTYCLQVNQHDSGKYVLYEYTISSSNTWEKKTITFSGNTSDAIANDNGRGLDINWHLTCHSDDHVAATTTWTAKPGGGTGSAYLATSNQVNLWDNSNNAWYLTGVQLEVDNGSGVATDFEHRSYSDELARCQRYFYSLVNGSGQTVGMASYYGDTKWRIPISFPTTMRANPSMVCSNNTGDFTGHSSAGAVNVATIGDWHNAASLTTGTLGSNSIPDNNYDGQASYIKTSNSTSSITFSAEL